MDGARAYDDEEFVARALQTQEEAAGLGEKGGEQDHPFVKRSVSQ